MDANSNNYMYYIQQEITPGQWVDALHSDKQPYVYTRYNDAELDRGWVQSWGGYRTRIVMRTCLEQVME